MVNESTNEKIISGKGLDPIKDNKPQTQSGNTTEQREDKPGRREDNFTKRDTEQKNNI